MDAQQAADAFADELATYSIRTIDGDLDIADDMILVRKKTVRTLLANYIEGLFKEPQTTPRCTVCSNQMDLHATWGTWYCHWCQIWGGQAISSASSEGERPGAGDTSGAPATPIDTEALANLVWDARHAHTEHPLKRIKRILDTALAQPVEVCEVRQQQDGLWTTSCGVDQLLGSPTEQCRAACPWCRKPIREVPYEEVGDGA